MQQDAIQKKLIHIQGQGERIGYLIGRARAHLTDGNYREYIELMEEIIDIYDRCETVSRNLLLHTTFIDKYQLMERVAHNLDIAVEQEYGWYKINIPAVLPTKRSGLSCNFIANPLAYALDQFVREHHPQRLRRCVICFRRIFDREIPDRAIQDTDNLEYKKLLDVVAGRLIMDDNGYWCKIMHEALPGDEERTIIFVMALENFHDWERQYPLE